MGSACPHVGSVIKVGGIPFCFRRRQSWTKMKPLWRVSSAYGTPHGWADGRHFLFSKKVYAHSVHEGLCRRARLMFVCERPRGSWRLADVLAQAAGDTGQTTEPTQTREVSWACILLYAPSAGSSGGGQDPCWTLYAQKSF